MRILLATKTMEVGGIERSVISISRELQKQGHAVWVVSSGGQLALDLHRLGVPHVFAPLEIASPFAVVRSAALIRRLLEEHAIDLVHSFAATASVAVRLALRGEARHDGLSQVRVVSSPMGLQNSPRELPITTWIRNRMLTLGAEQVLVISPEIRRHLKKVFTPESRLVDFNFVGLDLDRFTTEPGDYGSVREEFGFPPDARVISTIGALHPRKSHELFVESASLVLRQEPRARFLVVGEGELYQELEQQITRLGLEKRVVLTGVREDIPRLIGATDVYVKPGVVEGFIGITVLEALALRTPVIAFDTRDVRLALTDGETGVIVPNGDTRALAEAILRLLSNPEEGARLAEAGCSLVHERFAFSQLAERLEEIYRGILARPRPDRSARLPRGNGTT